MKLAELQTDLQPHQQRVIDKLKASGGLLVAHGVGSGKTLASIAAAEAMGLPIEAIVPAPLIANYHKEMAKHLGKEPEGARVRSYEKAVRDKDINLNALAVMDEAHRARNTGTLISKDVASQVAKAKARLLLTGTPVYNQASDLASLLNTAAGRKLLPDDPNIFKRTFVGEEKVDAPFLMRMKGRFLSHPVDQETLPKLINRERLIQAAKGYIDVHKGGGADFPERIDEVHHVSMGPRQWKMYQFHEGEMPWYLREKVRAGLPLDKKEAQEMNAFQGALRQASNTPRPYDTSIHDENEHEHTPKIQKMVSHLADMHANDPNFRGVVYSNYLNAGIEPMSRALNKAGISHSVFTGEVTKKKRDQMVKDYNTGKVPVLLVSGAGTEGLDLKGTKAIQLMEPHWNESRMEQVIGRGIRYQSHTHLPKDERKVKVMRYYSVAPPTPAKSTLNFLVGEKPKTTIETYIHQTAKTKQRLSDQIAQALQEASDLGPLKPWQPKMAKQTSHDEEFMQQLAKDVGDADLSQKGRTHFFEYNHPAQLTLKTPYDVDHIQKHIEEHFGGNRQKFVEELRNDMLSGGYAALGSVTKKNQQRKDMRALTGGAYGALAGAILGPVAAASLMIKVLQRTRNPSRYEGWINPALQFGSLFGAVGGSSVGSAIGKATYKDRSAKDTEIKYVHPLLTPPKVIKEKITVDIKEK